MKTIKIHFSRSTKKHNYFSRLLQWYEGIPVSHVLVEFDQSGLGQPFVFHSVIGSGVSFMAKPRFDKINEIMETYEIELSDEEYVIMRNALFENCGESYAFMQNIGILIVDQLSKLGIMSDNPFKAGKNCSELIYKYVIPQEYKTLGLVDDLVKPSQIRQLLLSNGHRPIFSSILGVS